MKTRQLSVREYCQLADRSHRSQTIQRGLKNGNLFIGMVSAKMVDNRWLVDCLVSWVETKEKEQLNRKKT